jgi:hypothetical protein
MFSNKPGVPFRAGRHRIAGQAMVEYLIVTGVLAAALFIPTGMTDNMSLADYAAQAIRSFFRGYSFLLSVT